MSLINCEISLILTWSKNYIISSATKATEFAITDTKPYVPVIVLSTENNIKLWTQLKYDLKQSVRINVNLN